MAQRKVGGWAVGWIWFAAVMMWIIGIGMLLPGWSGSSTTSSTWLPGECLMQLDVNTWG